MDTTIKEEAGVVFFVQENVWVLVHVGQLL